MIYANHKSVPLSTSVPFRLRQSSYSLAIEQFWGGLPGRPLLARVSDAR